MQRRIVCLLLMLWMALCPLFVCAKESAEGTLYLIRDHSLFGYMDRKGTVVIPAELSDAEPFCGGLAIVSETGSDYSFGLIDETGAYVVEPLYQIIPGAAENESDNWLYCLSTEKGDGYYDAANRTLFPPRDGLNITWWNGDPDCTRILACYDEKWGYLDRATGEVAIDFIYDSYDTDGFIDGYALNAVEKTDGTGSYPVFSLFDRNGRVVEFPEFIQPCYAQEGDGISEGMVPIEDVRSGLMGFGDMSGRVIVAPQYSFVASFSGGYAAVCVADMWSDKRWWGHVDANGTLIVTPRFLCDDGDGCLDTYYFHYGVATFENHDGVTAIDPKGNVLFECLNDEAFEYFDISKCDENGLVFYHVRNKQIKETTIAVRNTHGEVITQGEWQNAYSFSEGLCAVQKDGLWGYIDLQGKLVLPLAWDEANDFDEGLARVEKNNGWAYIDRSGWVVWQEPDASD